MYWMLGFFKSSAGNRASLPVLLDTDDHDSDNRPAVAYRRGVLGGFKPPKFRSFDKVEPDCKLRGKYLVFMFQHPN